MKCLGVGWVVIYPALQGKVNLLSFACTVLRYLSFEEAQICKLM